MPRWPRRTTRSQPRIRAGPVPHIQRGRPRANRKRLRQALTAPVPDVKSPRCHSNRHRSYNTFIQNAAASGHSEIQPYYVGDRSSGKGKNAKLEVLVNTAGTYYVSIREFADDTGTYQLKVVTFG